MTTIGGSRRSSALRSTKRVCGSGPSEASTSSITPSTIDSVRSTSPPKSAWPGVSTMLIRMSLVVDGGVLGQDGDAALALEVVAVHRALGDALVGAEGAALVQQGVDQRGLAVVDVGDDGDVAAERVGDVRLDRACEEGFSTDEDILSVYRTGGSGLGARGDASLRQARQDLLRALAELLVGRRPSRRTAALRPCCDRL